MSRAQPPSVRSTFRCLAVTLLLGLAALGSQAQYPNRPVRIVAPFGPGSASDSLLRIVADAKLAKGLDKREAYNCRSHVPDAPDDPHYTIRAWRGVVTYLLRRPEFLFE